MNDAILVAVLWFEKLVLGSVATLVAVLAVAALGFQMLAGRIDRRRGASVIFGCFVIFGAGMIGAGLSSWQIPIFAEPVHSVPPRIGSPASQSTFDPYAGAAPV